MMRSLYSGVSGMQNHQTRLDVIGNNVSNVNTVGFKRGRVNFQDMISQQQSGASRPTEAIGGINPKEIGLGVSIASIDTIFTQGNLQTTGVSTDVAIQGNGFFVLKNGDRNFYTRAGAFGIDENGTLVNPATGLRVQGYMARDVGGEMLINPAGDTEDLVIPIGAKDAPHATESVRFACNLNKNTPTIPAEGATAADVARGTWATELKIYDSFGNQHILGVTFVKNPDPAAPNSWIATVNVDATAENEENPANPLNTFVGMAGPLENNNTFTLNFDNNGTLMSAMDGEGNVSGENGNIVLQVAFDVPDANAGEDGAPARQQFSLDLGTIGSQINTVTQAAAQSTTKAFYQDGYTQGYLDNFKIDGSGTITGVYSNGTNRVIGQIAMASFTNQGGLEKAGDSTYIESNNSGMANINVSGIAGKGKMIAGALEMSNVDLTEQFTDMITTQRGFQANSKTITTADTLLETVLNLKR